MMAITVSVRALSVRRGDRGHRRDCAADAGHGQAERHGAGRIKAKPSQTKRREQTRS
jgi:hypothetical protein